MNEHVPAISVLLPVYNGASYLAEAIESILNQTWKDFELIILNDGSTDASEDIILGFDDQRIRYYKHENIGLAATLNRGAELSVGSFIARQDQDDISYPERFAKQLGYLEAHLDCALVGSWADIVHEGEKRPLSLQHSTDSALIKLDLLFSNPFVHSSVMMRKVCLLEVGGYSIDPSRQPPEDFELWSRIARRYDMANLPEVLVTYREVASSMSRSAGTDYWEHVVTVCRENILAALGNRHDPEIVRGAARLYHDVGNRDRRPHARDLVALIRDLAVVFEMEYPEYRSRLRARLTHFLNILLHRHYVRYVGVPLAKYFAQLRSLWLYL